VASRLDLAGVLVPEWCMWGVGVGVCVFTTKGEAIGGDNAGLDQARPWGVRAVRPNRALDAKGPDPRYVSRYSIFVLWPQPPKLEPSKLERHVRGCQFVFPHVDSANWLPHRRLRVLHFHRAAATAFFPAATCDSVRLRVRGGASTSRARGNN